MYEAMATMYETMATMYEVMAAMSVDSMFASCYK